MTFPVRIEHGNHVINTQMHALPREGDRLHCAFPASLPVKLFLRVDHVWFHQPVDFEGRDCPEPFTIVVTTEEDPKFKKENTAAMKTLLGGE